jgi:DNA processing protein
MIQMIPHTEMPACLRRIHSSPKQLFVSANDESTLDRIMRQPRVAIVGSRLVSTYGQIVTERLASQLAAHGVVIISGLAFGVDAIAHRAALKANGLSMAVLPGSVERVHPRSHQQLAQQLIDSGGALVSEYPKDAITYKTNFVARNRIVSGLADALLITEAAEKSGTIHTATFAMEQGIDVLVVPGNITSPTSAGTNNLIKTGAIPVTTVGDILHAIGIHAKTRKGANLQRIRGANADEQQLVNLMEQGIFDGGELLHASGFGIEKFNHHLTMLEITAKIRSLGANQWSLC